MTVCTIYMDILSWVLQLDKYNLVGKYGPSNLKNIHNNIIGLIVITGNLVKCEQINSVFISAQTNILMIFLRLVVHRTVCDMPEI